METQTHIFFLSFVEACKQSIFRFVLIWLERLTVAASCEIMQDIDKVRRDKIRSYSP